jgi:hypothetical protein
MRKLLFVHDEQYLELAIRNVQDLLGFEQRLADGNHVSDLLAVLLMSAEVFNELLSADHRCDLQRVTNHDELFRPDSISVNGRWTLVTLSHDDFQEPRTRRDAVDRFLALLRTQGILRDPGTVFRVSWSEEPHPLVCDYMHFLKSEQLPN